MNEKTLKALDQSIDHWNRMASGNRKPGEEIFSNDCALCGLFNKTHWERCLGCPVREKTGFAECRFSPWLKAHHAWIRYGPDSKQFRTAAERQVEFLESLHPPTPNAQRPR